MSERYRRILVPLDGSNLAEAVLPVTVLLAQALRAKVVLLHIIEEHAPQTVHGDTHLTSPDQATSYLDGIAQRYADKVAIEQHVHGTEENNVAQSIAAHVDELGADMIALCTHGRSGLHRVVSGSIAQQVLRKVNIPILLVRPDMALPDGIKSLLVPLDGTQGAEAALSTAMELARACQATVHLAVVVPTVETVKGDRFASARLTPLSTAAALNVEEEQTRAYLDRMVERLRVAGVEATEQVHRGDTVQVLTETASQAQPDLIVIATHGRSGIDAVWVGSVAANLIGRVAQPVLMVRI